MVVLQHLDHVTRLLSHRCLLGRGTRPAPGPRRWSPQGPARERRIARPGDPPDAAWWRTPFLLRGAGYPPSVLSGYSPPEDPKPLGAYAALTGVFLGGAAGLEAAPPRGGVGLPGRGG